MEEISTIVPGVNRGVRFAGVATQKGEIVEGVFQNEIEPLLDQSKEQQLYLDSLSAVSALRDFSESPGDVVYNIAEYRREIY